MDTTAFARGLAAVYKGDAHVMGDLNASGISALDLSRTCPKMSSRCGKTTVAVRASRSYSNRCVRSSCVSVDPLTLARADASLFGSERVLRAQRVVIKQHCH